VCVCVILFPSVCERVGVRYGVFDLVYLCYATRTCIAGPLKVPLPLQADWPEHHRTLAARLYMSEMVSRVLALENTDDSEASAVAEAKAKGSGDPIMSVAARAFLSSLYTSRFHPLTVTHPSILDTHRSYCLSSLSDMDEDVWEEVWDDGAWESEYTQVGWEDVWAESGDDMREAAADVVASFARVEDNSERRVWLGNYCEILALSFVNGNLRRVAAFLHDMATC
jgi:hypothetical protein